VTVVEGSRSLTGRGMEYNNDTRELVLHSDVQARFEPEKK
jgi:lipopolysaccharide export system protein LptC